MSILGKCGTSCAICLDIAFHAIGLLKDGQTLQTIAPISGRWIRLPRSRRLVTDLLHFARDVPSEGVIGNWNIAPVARLRQSVVPRIGWAALFMRAYGLVSARFPVLRQVYMKWPIPHLYEHPQTVARMTVARNIDGENWLFFARIISPEAIPLRELQRTIDSFKESPVERVPSFQRQTNFSRYPVFIRRPIWWWALNSSGTRHAYRFGTFAMTSISGYGATAVQPKCLSTSTLTFGPVDNDGQVDVRIIFDHRVFDGALAGDILSQLKTVLETDIVDELRSAISAPAKSKAVPTGCASF